MATQSSVRLNIKPEKVIAKAGELLEKNMRIATIWLRDRVKVKLNVGQPVRITKSGAIIGLDPSRPGEPPHKITGQLQNSIGQRVDRTATGIVGVVGTSLKKGRWLELGTSMMAARPYLRVTLVENRRRILGILTKGKQVI